MWLKVNAVVVKVNKGDDVNFVTFLDGEQGGLFKLTIPGEFKFNIKDEVDLEAIVEAGIGKWGPYLKAVEVVSINKIK